MNIEITDHVPGLSEADLARAVAESEAGYDIEGRPVESNPHVGRVELVPEDLLDAIDQRAELDGQSREEIVRRALTTYLHTA